LFIKTSSDVVHEDVVTRVPMCREPGFLMSSAQIRREARAACLYV